MSAGRPSQAARILAAAALLAVTTIPMLSGTAAGEESLSDLEARMESIQAELNAGQQRIEDLRTRNDELSRRIVQIRYQMDRLRSRQAGLQEDAVDRATEMYMQGNEGFLEVLLASTDFSDMVDRTELLSAASQEDTEVFIELARSQTELDALESELEGKTSDLADVEAALEAENAELQERFEAVAGEYDELKAALAKQRAAAASQPQPQPQGPVASNSPAPQLTGTDGMYCPVAGPVSFIDSWGAPRSGHTHQGVDMMAAYGTPIVAITSGTITYAAYNGSGGNMIFLTGDDGHDYWYMHNQENLVTGGRVKAGEQIATVGDTGNATGTPHLHFEYHPGGGSAINPYPLVASLC